MNPVEKAPGNRPLRDENERAADAPTLKRSRIEVRAPEVRLQSAELRADRSDGGSDRNVQREAIELPVAELMALAKKNRPASGEQCPLEPSP